MKSSSDRLRWKGWSLPLAGLSFLALIWGCQTSDPPTTSSYPAPSSLSDRSRVDQFGNGTAAINPNLFELNNPPTYQLKTIGGKAQFTTVNNFKTLASASGGILYGSPSAPMGANGDPNCFYESGAVTDLGDFEYPSIDLQAQFEAGAFYDMSPWKGVKFMMKVGASDSTTHRIFSIPVYQTQAVAGGGGCLAGPKLCYDHFAADYSAGTGGQWQQFNYLFSDLHQLVAGAIPDPPTLSGTNLQQVLWLQWEEGRNNSPGSSKVDLWIDDIEFY